MEERQIHVTRLHKLKIALCASEVPKENYKTYGIFPFTVNKKSQALKTV